MVFTTVANLVRARGPDEFWRKRKIFKLAAHFTGRKRNCYSIAIRYVHRALVYATKARKLRKDDMRKLWETRVTAGSEEQNIKYSVFREALSRLGIMLNRKSLADLAAWEPFTFKSLTDVAKKEAETQGLNSIKVLETPPRVITKGMCQRY